MAWVNRTDRDKVPVGSAVNSTNSIGPGSYETLSSKRNKPCHAPFGTSDLRKIETNTQFITPGPGSYDYLSRGKEDDIIQENPSSMFQSKIDRSIIDNKKMNTPGPGSYSTVEGAFKSPSKASKGLVNRNNKKGAEAINDSIAGIKWMRIPTAPSIPCVAQSFGYEEGPCGQLVIQKPVKYGYSGRSGDTVGPGYYSYKSSNQIQTRASAANFSKSTTSRTFGVTSNQVPGPGHYDMPEKLTVRSNTKIAQQNVNKRMFDKLAKKRKKKATVLPGPGSYSHKGAINVQRKPEHLQFFGSTCGRFESSRNNISPGPGSYCEVKSSFKVQTTVSSSSPTTYSVGFSSHESRFKQGKKSDAENLGPGSYDHTTISSEIGQKQTGRNNTFGSTTKRFISEQQHVSEQSSKNDEKPDSRTRTKKSFKDLRKKVEKKGSSNFSSSTTRFQQPSTKASSPCPGSYELKYNWGDNQGKGLLASATDRFPKSHKKEAENSPGPGSYAVELSSLKAQEPGKENFSSTKPRFPDKPPLNLAPGPGSYNTAAAESDWNRPTYNITIAEEMEKKMHTY